MFYFTLLIATTVWPSCRSGGPLTTTASPAVEASDDFGVGAARAAQRDGAALDAIVFHQENDFLAAVVAHGVSAEYELGRWSALPSAFFSGSCAEEGDLDAHVGQDARIELEERNAHFHGGLLAIGGGNDGAHAGWEFPSRDRHRESP